MTRAGTIRGLGGAGLAGLALGLVLAVPGTASAQDVIALRSAVVVEGAGPVTLRDVAQLSGAQAQRLGDVVLEESAATRADGSWRRIALADVRAALETRDDINWGRLVLRGSECSVRRAGAPPRAAPVEGTAHAPVDGPTVRDLVCRRIGESLGVAPVDLRLNFDEGNRGLLDTPVAGRTADIQLMGSSERQPVSVRLFEGLAMVASGTARVGVSVRRTVAASAGALRRGDVIKPENLVIEDRWLPPGKRPAPADSVAGTVVRTRIEAGEVIEAADIEAPIVVRRGDLVDVYCLCGTISLKATARATETGRDGDMVKFQSPESRRTFLARMDGPGRAITGVPAGVGAGAGTEARATDRPGRGGRTDVPAPPAHLDATPEVVEVGGIRVTRSARPDADRRARAVRQRLADLADRPLVPKEDRP